MKYVIDLFSILYEAYLFSVFFRTLERRERLKRLYRLAFYALFIVAMGVLYYFVPNAWMSAISASTSAEGNLPLCVQSKREPTKRRKRF